METIKGIKKTYGNKFDYMLVDEAGYYWEECMNDEWYASGEYGWRTTTEQADFQGIKNVNVSTDDGIVFIYINGEL